MDNNEKSENQEVSSATSSEKELLVKTSLGLISSNTHSARVLLETAGHLFEFIDPDNLTFTDINHINEALTLIERSVEGLNSSVEQKLCELEKKLIEEAEKSDNKPE